MRGNHRLGGLRFIPTRVGQTTQRVAAAGRSGGSSPRVWGRPFLDSVAASARAGSSPRVWGRLWFGSAADRTYRFIPTRVGQTRSARCWPGPGAGSSPRVWGRRRPLAANAAVPTGSSPRVWGRPLELAGHDLGGRFIPTRVGQTPDQRTIRAYHCGSSPRVWGRRVRATACTAPSAGSSPRVWGRHRPTALRWRGNPVHPHACGADGGLVRRAGTLPTVHPHACGADPAHGMPS